MGSNHWSQDTLVEDDDNLGWVNKLKMRRGKETEHILKVVNLI